MMMASTSPDRARAASTPLPPARTAAPALSRATAKARPMSEITIVTLQGQCEKDGPRGIIITLAHVRKPSGKSSCPRPCRSPDERQANRGSLHANIAATRRSKARATSLGTAQRLLILGSIMAEPRGLRFQEQLDRSYETVRDLLHREPLALLQRATASAVSRAHSPVATLHARVGGVEISVDVRVRITRTRDQPPASSAPATRLDLSLEATSAPALFPAMLAELSARPVSANETLL